MRFTALADSIAALAMSATAVFAAAGHPNNAAVPTAVEATDTAEPTDSAEPTETPDPSEALAASDAPDASNTPDSAAGAGAQGAHGALVSVAAQDPTLVGRGHNNHGGAVSAIARVTTRQAGQSRQVGVAQPLTDRYRAGLLTRSPLNGHDNGGCLLGHWAATLTPRNPPFRGVTSRPSNPIRHPSWCVRRGEFGGRGGVFTGQRGTTSGFPSA